MPRRLFGLFDRSLAIDLGTANTLIHVEGKGIVVNEPSCVAMQNIDHNHRKVLAVGKEAKAMIGRTPDNVLTLRPIRDGVIADFQCAEALVTHLFKKVSSGLSIMKTPVAVCVPSGITEVERRAVRESFERAGAGRVYLFSEPLAAAVGAGLPVTGPSGSMIVDMGGGTTEVAVLSLGGIVYSESVRVGGDKLDETVAMYLKKSHNLVIGEQTAERTKIAVGAAIATKENRKMKVTGRDLGTALPKTVEICEEEIVEALLEPIKQVIETIKRVLEFTPPELASDITERGITLAGGGALVRNFDTLVARETGLPVSVSEDPMTCCVTGCRKILRDIEKFPTLDKETSN